MAGNKKVKTRCRLSPIHGGHKAVLYYKSMLYINTQRIEHDSQIRSVPDFLSLSIVW